MPLLKNIIGVAGTNPNEPNTIPTMDRQLMCSYAGYQRHKSAEVYKRFRMGETQSQKKYPEAWEKCCKMGKMKVKKVEL